MQPLYRIIRLGIDVQFLWVPAHVGIWGNEVVDHLAKNGLDRNQVEVAISLSKIEAKAFIWNRIKAQWQRLWDRDTKGRHLGTIQQKVGDKSPGQQNKTGTPKTKLI